MCTNPWVHRPRFLTLLPMQDVHFSHTPQPGTLGLYTEASSDGHLPTPRPITVVDGIYYADDALRYHYVINEVLL